MEIERFQRGIEILREVERSQRPFYLNFWFADDERPYDCNTAACAAGWMIRNDWMGSEGLNQEWGDPVYMNERGIAALAMFFDITHYDAQFLFTAEGYNWNSLDVTAGTVADRMEQMLERHAVPRVLEAA